MQEILFIYAKAKACWQSNITYILTKAIFCSMFRTRLANTFVYMIVDALRERGLEPNNANCIHEVIKRLKS